MKSQMISTLQHHKHDDHFTKYLLESFHLTHQLFSKINIQIKVLYEESLSKSKKYDSLFTFTTNFDCSYLKSGNVADLNKDEEDCQTKTLPYVLLPCSPVGSS